MEQKQASIDGGMTFDEFSMRRSSHFLNALEDLKSLRPHLYFAADYCEKSYLHNQEQKTKVLDNSKDYAVKALVNAVDHIGNVASKLNDLLSNETAEIAATELRIDCLKQRVLACKEYTDGKALRQQCLVQTIPRFHRHYVLPEAGISGAGAGKNSYIGLDSEQERLQLLHLEFEVSVSSTSASSSQSQSVAETPRSTISSHFSGAGWKDFRQGTKSSSFGNNQRSNVHHPPRSKGFLLSFLSGRRSAKGKPRHVS
uniref:Uncharacterized protein n=1 Tax=Picea sitchensis TaxID=3332 RepID=C0PS22_PICSI|nr:unknown [Picea sitchensis]